MASESPPSSILIVGSGVFGLGTAYALTQRPAYVNTKITLLERLPFPAPDGSSIDSSRIVRADYADPAYTLLMQEAHPHWRSTPFGQQGRYTEAGLCIVMDDDNDLGKRYMNASLENVQAKLGLRKGKREEGGEITVLDSEEDVRKVMKGFDGEGVGKCGYVNWTSGWAHAEDGVKYLRSLVENTGRVDFQTKEVSRLLFSPSDKSVLGVRTTDGSETRADLTILATGAWTPSLLDLRGIASANGQIMAYLSLTDAEQATLGSNPTILNESSGMFIIQPRDNILKVARHGYGYANPVSIPHPEKDPSSGEKITISLPYTHQTDPHHSIPPEGLSALRTYLAATIPSLASRPFTHTRICWYTDTPSSDWLITHHPTYNNLFLATGGSGHGYKFLPVIGERVVDVLQGVDRDGLGRVLREKWKWPGERFRSEHVWTDDWRGGRKGMVLGEEMGWGKEQVGRGKL